MSLVVDASVVVKWVVAEEGSDQASAWQGQPLMAPDFMVIELANILWKKVRTGEILDVQALAGLAEIETAISFLPAHGLHRRALEIGLELAHSVYDCLYLALTESLETRVLTADKRLVRVCADTEFASYVEPLT